MMNAREGRENFAESGQLECIASLRHKPSKHISIIVFTLCSINTWARLYLAVALANRN